VFGLVLLNALPACDTAEGEMVGGNKTTEECSPPCLRDASATEASDDAGTTQSCDVDSDCDDGRYCDGVERCTDGRCTDAAVHPCAAGLQCDEASRRCDCHMDNDGMMAWFCGGPDADADGDGVDAMERGGDDCDDRDRQRFPGNIEICDYAGHDEDCKSETVALEDGSDPLADKDRDGYIDFACTNLDRATQELHRHEKPDCDDSTDETHPEASEDCDEVDNDCDGFVDELPNENRSFSGQITYCRDADGDGWSVHDDQKPGCQPPLGYIVCRLDQAGDCDDRNASVHPQAEERCDGVDNDCDGKVDADDHDVEPLLGQPALLETRFSCTDGAWTIEHCPEDRLWCHRDTALRGCETDATALRSCSSCETNCSFACGRSGCEELSQIAGGSDFACGLTSGGRVACWGHGDKGQLGNDAARSSSTPRAVLGITEAKQVAAGEAHACAIRGDDAEVYCWGRNEHSELANPDAAAFSSAPLPAYGVGTTRLTGATQVATGAQHTCAVLNDGKVACWGATKDGRLATPVSDSGAAAPFFAVRVVPDPDFGSLGHDITDARAISLGDAHSCMLTATGAVECWGSNAFGQLGADPSLPSSPSPLIVSTPSGVRQIAAGGSHTCALAAGRAYCWGANDKLQLGRPSDENDWKPAAVEGLDQIEELSAGMAFSCARSVSGATYCWGNNESRTLATATVEVSASPLKLPFDSTERIATGGSFACATRRNAETLCWGSNLFGQLGDDRTSLSPQPEPVEVVALEGSR
jgi:alpha-tubulin suppressor-like RCC1 family protein